MKVKEELAHLSKEDLKKISDLEKELGVVLLAFEDDGVSQERQ